MKRRRVIQIVVILVLGAIVNVAVAWGCAAWSADAELYNVYWLGTSRPPAPERFQPLLPAESDWISNELIALGFARREYFGVPEIYLNLVGGSGGYPPLLGITLAGWPCHSLTCMDTHLDKRWSWNRKYEHAIVIQRKVDIGGPIDLPRPLPLLPIWPGFAINTMFYAAILGVVFVVPGTVRRRIRCRRGLCPACAYPIGTSEICTECGTKLPLPLQRERAGVRVRESLCVMKNSSSTVIDNPHPDPLPSKGEGKERTT